MNESRGRYWYRALNRPCITPLGHALTLLGAAGICLVLHWELNARAEAFGALQQQLREVIGINKSLMKHFNIEATPAPDGLQF